MNPPADRIEEASWHQHRLLILSELKRLNDGMEALIDKLDGRHEETTKELSRLNAKVSELNVRASVLGLISGAIGGFLGMFMKSS